MRSGSLHRALRRVLPPAVISMLCLLTAACFTTPPPPLAGADPADAGAHVKPAAYGSVLGRYTSRRPVDPGPWREQNERVAPTPRQ
jgi:hypothetical protein